MTSRTKLSILGCVLLLLLATALVLLLLLRSPDGQENTPVSGVQDNTPPDVVEPARRRPPKNVVASAHRHRELLAHLKQGEEPASKRPNLKIQTRVRAAPLGNTPPEIYVHVKSAVPLVNACYRERLKKRPELAGSITVGFTVVKRDHEAAVDNVDVMVSSLKDFAIESCILRALSKIRLPAHLADKKRRRSLYLNLSTRTAP